MYLTVSMFPIRHACTQQTTAWQEKKKGKKTFPVSGTNGERFWKLRASLRWGKKNERICTMEHILLVMAYNGSVTVIWGLSRGK